MAGLLVLSLLVGLGSAANQAAAMRIDPDRGPGPAYSRCQTISSEFFTHFELFRGSTTLEDHFRYARDIIDDYGSWSSWECDKQYGNLYTFTFG